MIPPPEEPRAFAGHRLAPESMPHNRLLAILILACSAALLAPLLRPLLTGRVFVYDDLSWFHLPMRYLFHQALHSGDTVLWTPSILGGFYLQGEGQIGLFHPFHQVLYRFLPLGTAFNLELIANYPAAFAGMFWFLRRLRFSHAAALFGAMLFAFSGFNLLHHHHINMIAVVVHMPWLLGAADVLIVEERKRARAMAFAAVAVIICSELLLGFPQGVWWNGLSLAAFSVFRAGETRRWRRLLACSAAVVLGVMLGGIQLLPSADAAAHSTRAGLSREFALTYSMHPFNLLQLWSPYFFERGGYTNREATLFHEFGIYSGAILTVSLIWVWLRRDALRERRALVTGATVFAAVALVLALGRYGGLAVLLTYVPVLQSLRAPVRYIMLVQFALVILAAITIEDLLSISAGRSAAPSRPSAALWIPAGLGIVTTIVLSSGVLGYGRYTFASARTAYPGVAMVALVTLLVQMAGRRVRWAIAALVIVTAADLFGWGIRFIERVPAQKIYAVTKAAPEAPNNAADAYAFGMAGGPYWSNVLVLRGYRLTSGYVGLFPAAVHPLDSEVAMRLTGTRWLFTRDGERHAVEGSAERVRLLDERGGTTTGSARLTVDRPGYLVAEVTAPARRTVAFTERFHDGWSATSNGVPLEMVRVEGDFLGTVLDGGVHQVRLRFMPRSFVYGSILSGVGAALLAGVLIALLR
jgi:hypothetical protein